MNTARNFIPVKAKAALGLALLKEAILDHLERYPDGLRNTDLRSISDWSSNDYLTYSILGLLLKERQIEKEKRGAKVYYVRTPM